MKSRKQIFISYRRSDEPGYAGWLYQLIEEEIGKEKIFKDIEGGFWDGDDFPDEIYRIIKEVKLIIAVIGPSWLVAKDKHGQRRLDDPNDWVRIEIANALKLKKRVIPVLVNDAEFFQATALPNDLKPLARKHVRRLSVDRFAQDAKILISNIPSLIANSDVDRPTEVDSSSPKGEQNGV
ncbi:MAG: toll/interleukin-1 receptor domain-containing protein, partial [Pseudomonadota bacterium]